MLSFFSQGGWEGRDGGEGEQPQRGPQTFPSVRGVMGCAEQPLPFHVCCQFTLVDSRAGEKGEQTVLTASIRLPG